MSRNIVPILLAATLAAMLTACELESSNNGDLDGYWHMQRVDTLSTGGSTDLSDSLRFWAVQMSLLNLTDKGGDAGEFLLRFAYDSDSLRLYDPHYSNRMTGDPSLDDAAPLAPYGINAVDETFAIERLNGSYMTLKGGTLRLQFNKL